MLLSCDFVWIYTMGLVALFQYVAYVCFLTVCLHSHLKVAHI